MKKDADIIKLFVLIKKLKFQKIYRIKLIVLLYIF